MRPPLPPPRRRQDSGAGDAMPAPLAARRLRAYVDPAARAARVLGRDGPREHGGRRVGVLDASRRPPHARHLHDPVRRVERRRQAPRRSLGARARLLGVHGADRRRLRRTERHGRRAAHGRGQRGRAPGARARCAGGRHAGGLGPEPARGARGRLDPRHRAGIDARAARTALREPALVVGVHRHAARDRALAELRRDARAHPRRGGSHPGRTRRRRARSSPRFRSKSTILPMLATVGPRVVFAYPRRIMVWNVRAHTLRVLRRLHAFPARPARGRRLVAWNTHHAIRGVRLAPAG